MSLTIYIGPMFSGKTSKLIELYNKYKDNNNCIMITPDIDTRTKKTNKWTHDGYTYNGDALWTSNIMNNINKINKYDIIFVNEAQFIDDLYNGIIYLIDNLKKHVYISGLDGDFNREPFQNIINLIPHAENVEKLYARCETCGCKASFSKKLINNNDKILIGGKETYEPRCRKHFLTN